MPHLTSNRPSWLAPLVTIALLLAGTGPAVATGIDTPVGTPSRLSFTATANGEFTFDTGVLRGTLRVGGKSLGLSSVSHLPTRRRLDRSNGLLSHYRVFSSGVRYGTGAWDWPSTARLLNDGTVAVDWPTAANRPFAMKAVYCWRAPAILELETIVQAGTELRAFEVFLAAYFDEAFTNALAFVKESPDSDGRPALLAARRSFGEWLMFPRSRDVVPLIQDGRWTLEPHPVNWTIMPELERPLAIRREPTSGLTAILSASPEDSFAIAMPHQAEGHYSVYFCLFGRDLKAGETARARTRLVIGEIPADQLLAVTEGLIQP